MAIRVKSPVSAGIDVRREFDALYDKLVMTKIRKRFAALRRNVAGDLEALQSIDSDESYFDKAEREAAFGEYLGHMSLMAEKNTKTAQLAGLAALGEMTLEECVAFLMNGKSRTQREIATKLQCSPATVNTILAKLKMRGFRTVKTFGKNKPCNFKPKKRTQRKSREK
jgi:DNA-binding CsgD family transcriptional regulator